MTEMFFHTIINFLWIIILTAVAAIASCIAYVAVKVVFCNDKAKDATNLQMNNEKV